MSPPAATEGEGGDRESGSRAEWLLLILRGEPLEALLCSFQDLLLPRYDAVLHQNPSVDDGGLHPPCHAVDQMGYDVRPGDEPGLFQVDQGQVSIGPGTDSAVQSKCPASIICGELPDLLRREGGRGMIGILLHNGCCFHLLEQAEVVVAGCAVRPQTYIHSGLHQSVQRCDARGQLQIAHSAGHHIGPSPLQEAAVLLREPDAVDGGKTAVQ